MLTNTSATRALSGLSAAQLARRYTYPEIWGEKHPLPSLPGDLRVETSLQFRERMESLRIFRLASPRSITVELGPDFLCDCHDLTNRPLAYRLHMYPGKDNRIPFELKLARMQSWQQAVLAFDSLMTIASDASFEQMARALHRTQLPKAEIAIISTGKESLQKLMKTLGAVEHKEPPQELIFRWKDLIDAAREGRIVEAWLKQKGR